ncbi:hypothetical protein [Antarcticirhabdus aurantiaca]|uniref:Uncharacterized protein n=1 Tax=Antarcticirhabdus aurantiaca TaxID=2606717 RepID=A0ACD4NQC6_9HYPH|nr:hypothetical protein [Antarcticirhabdus aurantiaca]WAJ28922.1 hypothetical protein OXU80_01315 [Jeongeuplla avenae]
MSLTISQHINKLLASFVEIEDEHAALIARGRFAEAEELSPSADMVLDEIRAIRTRDGIPDLIAARLLLELMITHAWPPSPDTEWDASARNVSLPILEAVADQTTGAVRHHARLALSTIGIEVADDHPSRGAGR